MDSKCGAIQELVARAAKPGVWEDSIAVSEHCLPEPPHCQQLGNKAQLPG